MHPNYLKQGSGILLILSLCALRLSRTRFSPNGQKEMNFAYSFPDFRHKRRSDQHPSRNLMVFFSYILEANFGISFGRFRASVQGACDILQAQRR